MYPQHLTYLLEKSTTWFDPCYGLTEFWKEYRRIGKQGNQTHEYVWGHRDFKKAKEIYATSIIAKAMSKSDGNRWWITKPKVDPPDGVIGTKIKKNDIEEMHVREVEIVEHLEGDVIDTLNKKLNNKRYEPHTVLVCLVSRGGFYDFKKLATVVQGMETSLLNIFLVFNGTNLANIPRDANEDELLRALLTISSIQLKPIYSHIDIDVIGDCKGWREGKTGNFFIFEGRGKGGSREITVDNPPTLF